MTPQQTPNSTVYEDTGDVGGLPSMSDPSFRAETYQTTYNPGFNPDDYRLDPNSGFTPETYQASTDLRAGTMDQPADMFPQIFPQYYNDLSAVEPAPQPGGLPMAGAPVQEQQDNTSDPFANWQQQQELRQQEVARRIAENNNVLSGNIMAGASWNSLNPTLADELTQATGQQTYNTAVGGATTADTLKQLNDFTAAGGSFAPGSNVFLQTGGIDLVSGLDKDTIQNNIDQIVSKLGEQGVNVVLTGSPYAASFDDVRSNNFNPQLDAIYNNIAANRSNVSLVDTMGSILQNKDLLSDFIHPNKQGWGVYNQSVLAALNELNNRNRTTEQG